MAANQWASYLESIRSVPSVCWPLGSSQLLMVSCHMGVVLVFLRNKEEKGSYIYSVFAY